MNLCVWVPIVCSILSFLLFLFRLVLLWHIVSMATEAHFCSFCCLKSWRLLALSAVRVASTTLARMSMGGHLCMHQLSFSICTFQTWHLLSAGTTVSTQSRIAGHACPLLTDCSSSQTCSLQARALTELLPGVQTVCTAVHMQTTQWPALTCARCQCSVHKQTNMTLNNIHKTRIYLL